MENVPTRKMSGPNLDSGELPASYGTDRLVLLPVDPYLLHAYWDLASPMSEGRAVLRLHETPAGAEESRSFDIEVNLGAGNWYVHLWSPDKVYYAELGLREEDGSLELLARSNTIRTAPSRPKPAPVDPRPLPAPASVELGLQASELVNELEAALESEPAIAGQELLPAVETIDAVARIQKRLAELYAESIELPPTYEPWMAPPDELVEENEIFEAGVFKEFVAAGIPFRLEDLPELDLTGYSEERFSPGEAPSKGSFGY